MKSINAPHCEEIVTIDDHIKSSEILKNMDVSRTFDYELNDKALKTKLVNAAKRSPMEIEENTSSSNLIFSAGAWSNVVLPSVKYFNEVKGEKTCKVGEYTVKVGGVKAGKENSGKHVNTQVVFFADRDKIICHLYNTTQLILVNGHGYNKFIDLFLKPFLQSKINECLKDIENTNDEIYDKLVPKTSRRSNVKLKCGPSFPCHSCDYVGKSNTALRKHKKSDHVLSINTSNKKLLPKHSTRNNSVIENLMIEDLSSTNLLDDSCQVLEAKTLTYTCFECNFVTKSKSQLEEHVNTHHGPDKNEELRFLCMTCKCEFKEIDQYDDHVKLHENTNKKVESEIPKDLENLIFLYILEQDVKLLEESNNIDTGAVENSNKLLPKLKCTKCDFETNNETWLKSHIDTDHIAIQSALVKCDICYHEFELKEQLKTHNQMNHAKDKVLKNEIWYTCNVCDFGSTTKNEVWNHKLDDHAGQIVDFKSLDKNERNNLFFKYVAEQNADLMEEVENLKKGIKLAFEQVTYEFEENMNAARNETTRQNAKISEVLLDIQKKICRLEAPTRTIKKIDTPTTPAQPSPKSKGSCYSSTTSQPSIPSSPLSKPSKVVTQLKDARNKNDDEAKDSKSKRKTPYQLRAKALYIGDSVSHNTNFRKLEVVTNCLIKTSKAYSSIWDEHARFKHLNITDVSKKELAKGEFDHLVLGAPTVDISNLDTSNVKATDNTEELKTKVETSCQNMIKVAEDALENNPKLQNVTIMNHAPRFDGHRVDPIGLKQNLANFANSYLLELWLDSPHKNKVLIGSHSLDCSKDIKNRRYTDPQSGRYDGVHMYGDVHKTVYTESVLNILLNSFQTQPQNCHNPAKSSQARQGDTDDYHTRCPQTVWQKQKRPYSSVVSESQPIQIKNRFSPLGNC